MAERAFIFDPQRLRQLRRERGMTQAALAEALHIGGPTTISQLERGLISEPSMKTVQRLAAALHCHVTDLGSYTDETAWTLARYRERLGLTQADLGRLFGLNVNVVSDIERGYFGLPTDLVPGWAKTLGVRRADVIEAWHRARTDRETRGLRVRPLQSHHATRDAGPDLRSVE